jgi:hypothetical protein
MIPLKIGTSLSGNDQLTLNVNAEVKIICNNYTLFTVTAGKSELKVPVKNYSDSCRDQNQSMTANMLKYIWVRFKNEEQNDSHPDRNSNLQEYGAAMRGCTDSAFKFLPDSIAVFRKGISIKYYPTDSLGEYTLNLYTDQTGGIPHARIHLTHNRFDLANTANHGLDADINYYYSVIRNGIEHCNRKCLLKLSDRMVAGLINDQKNVQEYKDLSQDGKDFVTGYFLEQHHLFGEAMEYYDQSLKTNPKNDLATTSKKRILEYFDIQ